MGAVSAKEHLVAQIVAAPIQNLKLPLLIAVLVFAEGLKRQPTLSLLIQTVPLYLSCRGSAHEILFSVIVAYN